MKPCIACVIVTFNRIVFFSSLQLLSRLLIAPGQDLQGFEQSA